MTYHPVVLQEFEKFVRENPFQIEADSVAAIRLKNTLQHVYDIAHSKGYADYYYDHASLLEDNFNIV